MPFVTVYDLKFPRPEVSIHSILGTTSETQGWVLRRCLSKINRIGGRKHRPRDDYVRELCAVAGFEWPDPPARSSSHNEVVPFEGSGDEEEGSESDQSEFCDDEELPLADLDEGKISGCFLSHI